MAQVTSRGPAFQAYNGPIFCTSPIAAQLFLFTKRYFHFFSQNQMKTLPPTTFSPSVTQFPHLTHTQRTIFTCKLNFITLNVYFIGFLFICLTIYIPPSSKDSDISKRRFRCFSLFSSCEACKNKTSDEIAYQLMFSIAQKLFNFSQVVMQSER